MINDKWKKSMGIAIIFLAVIKFYGGFFGYNSVAKFMMLASLGLSGLLILSNIKNYSLIQWGFLGIVMVQGYFSKNISIAYTYILCLGLITVDFKTLVKWFAITNALLFSLYLITNLVGINPTEYIEGRNDFGFGNPNTAFVSMFLIWSSYFYYVYNKASKLDYILLGLLIFLMYTQTTTRTGLLTAGGTIVAAVVLKKFDINKKGLRWFITLFPAIMGGLSLLIALFFSGNYFINKMLSHRPIYWHSYILHPTKGVNLFGYTANIKEILFTQRMPLDSGYLWTLYSLGLVVFVCLTVAMCYTLYNLCLRGEKDKIILIVTILIYCFAESIMTDLATNMGMILVVYGMGEFRFKKVQRGECV